MMSPRAIATPAALLLRLLLVVVYILPFVQSYSTLYQPTPPPGLPPSLSRRTNYDGRKTQLSKHSPLKPLSAYSVSAGAAKDSNRPSLWRSSFWKLPTPLEKLASEFGFFHQDWTQTPRRVQESLFSCEGGGGILAATRPVMPYLDMSEVVPAVHQVVTIPSSPPSLAIIDNSIQQQQQQQQGHELITAAADMEMEKYSLLMEMSTLTDTFASLESMYVSKIDQLTERNNLIEAKLLQTLTDMEDDNSILRQRVRALELELSEVAYSSRKSMPLSVTTTVASSAAATTPLFVPKPPPNVPTSMQQFHQQQQQLEMYKHEQQSSARKVLQLSIRTIGTRIGKMLNMFNPVDNLSLWGELNGEVGNK